MKKLPLGLIAFFQAFGIILYSSLVGLIFINGNSWFGPKPGPFGPAIFLSLFAVSAVICSLIFLGYPFLLFWEHKQTKTALRLVIYSTAWLLSFVICGLASFALSNS